MTTSRKIDSVFDWADTAPFDQIDRVLQRLNPDRLNPHVAFAFVTASFPHRSHLPSRTIYAERLRVTLRALNMLSPEVEFAMSLPTVRISHKEYIMTNELTVTTATNDAGLTMNDYQTAAMRTAVYPSPLMQQVNVGDCKLLPVSWVYPAMKLAGETGEVSEKLGKILRDQHGVMTEDQRVQLKLELGDVLWYIAALARDLGWTLDEVAVANINKLASRAARGVIQGSGDNR